MCIRLVVTIIAFVVALGGCAGGGLRADTPPSIWDVAASRFVTEADLVGRLAAARYRLLGEIHDNPSHHRIRAELIRRIAATGARPAVVFEQFDLDRDAALVAAQHGQAPGGPDAESVATAGGFDRKGWQWPLHKPLLEAALAAALPIHAGNLPRSELMRAARAPAGTTTDAKWLVRFNAAPWTPAQDAQLREGIVEGHCGKLPDAAIAGIARAQRMRDAAMAEALVDAATRDGAILIAGDGHVRRDLAVPAYVQPARLDEIVAVGLLESTAEQRTAPGFPHDVVADHPGYDFLWFTATTWREDPCAQIPDAPAANPR